MKLNPKQLTITSYGSAIALGITATPAPKGTDKHVASKLAHAEVERIADFLFNWGATQSDPNFTHDQFAYVLTSHDKLKEALIAYQLSVLRNRLVSKPRKFGKTRDAVISIKSGLYADEVLKQIPHENFLVGQGHRNQLWAQSVDLASIPQQVDGDDENWADEEFVAGAQRAAADTERKANASAHLPAYGG